MERIVDALFPTHPLDNTIHQVRPETEISLFTLAELETAAKSMKNGKAPGLDGIPAEIIKLAVNRHPELFLKMYNSCLTY